NAGGFSDTSQFTDSSSKLRKAVSVIDGTGNRYTATFATGFTADYAIALAAHSGNGAGELFRLLNNGSHVDLGSVSLNPTTTSTASSYSFQFNLSDIGITAAPGVSFKFESSYI